MPLSDEQALQVWAGSFTGDPVHIKRSDRAYWNRYKPYCEFTEVAEVALHIRRYVRARQGDVGNLARVYTNAPDDVMGVRRTDRVREMTPTGWAMLATEATRPLFSMDFAQRQLPTLERKGINQARINPLVIVIDISGSMGLTMSYEEKITKLTFAKGLALTMVNLARAMSRPCYIVPFEGSATLYAIRPDSSFEDVWTAMSKRQAYGGTEFDAPLQLLLQAAQSEHWGKADIVFLTDGYSTVNEDLVTQWRAVAADCKIRMLGLIVERPHLTWVKQAQAQMETFCTQPVLHISSMLNEQAKKLHGFLASVTA